MGQQMRTGIVLFGAACALLFAHGVWGAKQETSRKGPVSAPGSTVHLQTVAEHGHSPHAARAPLGSIRDRRPAARFRPKVTGVEQWGLEVADSRGRTVAWFQGSGNPPLEITWDGTTIDGRRARSDLTYWCVLNATDKAGNRRSFIGDSFRIAPYVVDNKG